LDLDDPFI